MLACRHVRSVEGGCCGRLLRIIGPWQLLAGPRAVLPPALMVGIPSGTGPAHLQVLAGRVRTGKVARPQLREEELVDRGRGPLRRRDSLELPMRNWLALGRLPQENALLPSARAVQSGVFVKVGVLTIQ